MEYRAVVPAHMVEREGSVEYISTIMSVARGGRFLD